MISASELYERLKSTYRRSRFVLYAAYTVQALATLVAIAGFANALRPRAAIVSGALIIAALACALAARALLQRALRLREEARQLRAAIVYRITPPGRFV